MNNKNISKPLVSIIIPTFNSGNYIRECLESIKQQEYKIIEVIVVDQKSTDQTVEIAKSFGVKVISVEKPRFYSPPGRYRNIGFRKSKGEIIMHVDSDMQLHPRLVKEAVYRLDEKKVGALIVHEKDRTKTFWSKCKALERRCYWGNLNFESARIVRRKVFEEIGGYDEEISSGEDQSVHKKYEEVCQIGFCRNVFYHNIENLRFWKMMVKKYNYGKTASVYFEKTDNNVFSFFIEEFSCYIKNYRLVLKNPIVGFGMLFMKISEISFGMMGHLSNIKK